MHKIYPHIATRDMSRKSHKRVRRYIAVSTVVQDCCKGNKPSQ